MALLAMGERMRTIAAIIIVFLFCLFLLIYPTYGATTSTTSYNQIDRQTVEKVVITTANAANDIVCVDVRGYDYAYVAVDISNTINFDFDVAPVNPTVSSNEVLFSIGIEDDITADKGKSIALRGGGINVAGFDVSPAPYICIDVDSCTTCTLTATWYVYKTLFWR
jgi:ABC-type siderophore export system fused ATPase/permease subunit